MNYKFAYKALQFGLIAGILTTFFDGFFMLGQNLYVPRCYPLFILFFNLFFWILIYILFYLLLKLFLNKIIGKDITENELLSGSLSLTSFALIYGIIGKTAQFDYYSSVLQGCYDYHLSFLWVTILLTFSFFFRRNYSAQFSKPFHFIPELIIIIVLFLFCSNVNKISLIANGHNILKEYISISLKLYFNLVYFTGISLMFLFYLFALNNLKVLFKKPLITVIVSLFTICSSLVLFYSINQKAVPVQNSPRVITKEASKIPYIIIIVLDTLRADRLSVYGGRVKVPHLEKFSKDSMVFENCVANSSWTPPSHASLFTGLLPTEHGCHINAITGKVNSLSPEVVTLPELFNDNGYKTAAVVSNFAYLTPQKGFNRGFQIYDRRKGIGSVLNYPFNPIGNLILSITGIKSKYALSYRTAEDLNENIKYTLRTLGYTPFFLFINYMDAHAPYYPPPPYSSYFTDQVFPSFYRMSIANTMGEVGDYNEFWLSQYDGAIAYLDHNLGNLFNHLKALDIYDHSLIIVTSDHGEYFGEHGCVIHRCKLHQEVLHVPLIIKLPYNKESGKKEIKQITLRKLFCEISSICNLSPLNKDFNCTTTEFSAVAELYYHDRSVMRAFYLNGYKYIFDTKNTNPQLYNLQNDPSEQINVIEEDVELKSLLLKKTEDLLKRIKPKIGTIELELEETTADDLKSLGYVN